MKEKTLIKERIMRGVFLGSACICILCVALICLFLFANGVPAMLKIGPLQFLTGTVWKPGSGVFGIAPMILGSVYVTAGAVVCGVPGGVLTAVFMAKFCGKTLGKIIAPAVSLLAGVPSVICGFFALVVLVPLNRAVFGGSGKSLLTASILLGIMILPTIISVSEAALRSVPEAYYEGALALGATHEQAVFFTVLPAAKPGILAAVVLGIGRAVGETMAVVMVAGNQAVLPAAFPGSLARGLRTLTANIVLEMGYAADLHREALIATAVVLFVFILCINLLLSIQKRRSRP
ncbi:MAG: phosphate ABC transporter permease subunit PstC [Spirochaetaceae bacterium]|jgi:phosphate transport system permease protein|nr:phosphate ABC transporter permease subunit PstC [Spirochaetaceae bacterium]